MFFSHLIWALVLYSGVVAGKAVSGGYVYFKEGAVNGFLKLHRSPATWRAARLTCFDEGALLASPENDDFLKAMLAIMDNSASVFIGTHDTFSKGFLRSLEGTPLKKMPVSWAPGRPLLDKNETCLSMLHNGMVSDRNCFEELPFFCFKKPTVKPSCGPVGNGYSVDTTTGSCYKFHKEAVYWRDAYAACENEDGYLAIINSDDEAKVLKNLLGANGADISDPIIHDVVHLGFVNWGREGGLWMTIHGQTLKDAGYEKWHKGEPNNSTDQFCGGMYLEGTLDDVNCLHDNYRSGTRFFICEKKPTIWLGYL